MLQQTGLPRYFSCREKRPVLACATERLKATSVLTALRMLLITAATKPARPRTTGPCRGQFLPRGLCTCCSSTQNTLPSVLRVLGL